MAPDDMTQLVQRQVDAYNARDIDAFVATYAIDAVIRDIGAPRGQGHAWIRARYGPLFAGGSPPAEILGRVTAGDWVVDEELVRRPQGDVHVLAAYRLVDGLIAEVVFLQ